MNRRTSAFIPAATGAVSGLWRQALHGLSARLQPGKTLVASIPTFWLALFFLIPFVVVFKISLAEPAIAVPPYTALFEWDADLALASLQLNLGNYLFLFEDSLYLEAYLNSIKVAAISTFITLLVAYPMAYRIARSSPSKRIILLSLVILPFWTSFLLRVYAWMGFLKKNGVVNELLLSMGLIDEPLIMLQTDFAIYIGIIYTYLPFMVLPLYSTLEKLDISLLEAAEDLGCKPMQRFFLVTLPLSLPGMLAGCLLVFIPALGEYVIPALLGGSDTLMIGRVLWDEFFLNRDWPRASAVAILMLLFLVMPIMLLRNAQGRREERT